MNQSNAVIGELVNSLQNYGLLVDPYTLRTNGKIARCGTRDKPKGKNGWYVVFAHNDLINACFGNYSSGDGTLKWCSKQSLSPIEKTLVRRNMNAFRENFEKERDSNLIRIRRDFASFDLLTTAHPYLVNKGLSELVNLQLSNLLKVLCDSIVIPVTARNNLVYLSHANQGETDCSESLVA